MKLFQAVCASSSGVVIASSSDIGQIIFGLDHLANVSSKGELFLVLCFCLPSDVWVGIHLKKKCILSSSVGLVHSEDWKPGISMPGIFGHSISSVNNIFSSAGY